MTEPAAAAAFGRVWKGGAWLAAANATGASLLLVQGVIATRALGPDDFGRLAIVITFVTVGRMLLSFRMNECVVRYLGAAVTVGDATAAGATIRLAGLAEAATALAAWVGVMVLAPLAAAVFAGDGASPGLIALYSVVIPAGLFAETSLGVLQTYNRFDLQSAVQTAERVVTTVAVWIAAVRHGGVDGFVMASATGPVVSGLALTVLAVREARRNVGPSWHRAPLGVLRDTWRGAAGFAASTNAGATLSLVVKDADALWLGALRSPAEAGLYKLAYSVASLALQPVAPLAQTVYPEVARLVAAGQRATVRRLIVRSSRPVLLWVVALLAVSMVAGRDVLRLLYGAAFAPAAPALSVLLLGIGVSSVAFWARPVLLASGAAGYALFAAAVATAVKVAGVLVFVPDGGLLANAWVLAAAYGLGVGLLVHQVARSLREGQPR